MATYKIKPKYKKGDAVALPDGTVREIAAVYKAHGTGMFIYSLLENPNLGATGYLYVNSAIEERHLRELTDAELLKWRLTQ